MLEEGISVLLSGALILVGICLCPPLAIFGGLAFVITAVFGLVQFLFAPVTIFVSSLFL